MRLHEVLDTSDALEHIVETIKLHCAPYIQVLKQTNGEGLFRGSAGGYAESGHIKLISPRTSRIPKDTPADIHKFMNDHFTQKFNFPYRNGIFTTGNRSNATFYGSVNAIFPAGELKFIWSPKVDDLLYVVERIYDKEEYDDTDTIAQHPQLAQEFMNIVDSYQSTDLVAAIRSHHEVIFSNSCYMVNFNDYQAVIRELIQ